jgi:hypothetical protein
MANPVSSVQLIGLNDAPEVTPGMDLARVILDATRASDLALGDDDILIVTADHGEELGENERIEHPPSLSDAVQHIPWIVAGGGLAGGAVGSYMDSQKRDLEKNLAHEIKLRANDLRPAPMKHLDLFRSHRSSEPRILDVAGDKLGRRVRQGNAAAAVPLQRRGRAAPGGTRAARFRSPTSRLPARPPSWLREICGAVLEAHGLCADRNCRPARKDWSA